MLINSLSTTRVIFKAIRGDLSLQTSVEEGDEVKPSVACLLKTFRVPLRGGGHF